MYYFIDYLLRKVSMFVVGFPDSMFMRSFIAWIPVIIIYALPLFFVISASNYYRVHKEELGTFWLRITKILFCIDGAWVVIFLHKFPYAKYPVGLTILEIIISAVMLILIMANSDAKIQRSLGCSWIPLSLDSASLCLLIFVCSLYAWGKDVSWLRWDINSSVYCCLHQHIFFIRTQRRSRFTKISVSTFICHYKNIRLKLFSQ